MYSAVQHPGVIGEYLQKELQRGRMLGPSPDESSLPPLSGTKFASNRSEEAPVGGGTAQSVAREHVCLDTPKDRTVRLIN